MDRRDLKDQRERPGIRDQWENRAQQGEIGPAGEQGVMGDSGIQGPPGRYYYCTFIYHCHHCKYLYDVNKLDCDKIVYRHTKLSSVTD